MSALTVQNLQFDFKLRISKVLSFKVEAQKDRHARMKAVVYIDDCVREQIIETYYGEVVEVWETDVSGNKKLCLFAGFIFSLNLDYESNFELVTIEAVSGSVFLDAEKKKRSFQNTDQTYFDIISVIAGDNADALLHVPDKVLEKPVIQYEETDWQFVMRLASHLNVPVMPDFRKAAPRFHIGLRNGSNIGKIDCVNYKTGFDSRYYTDGIMKEIPKYYFIYHDVESYGRYEVGDAVSFLGENLRICALKYELVRGLLHCTYRLAAPVYLKKVQYYNDNLRGLSLLGTVLKTDSELLRVHLDIDARQDVKTAYDYTWRPETGNLMYCMPEIGDKISLYMQNSDEFSAVCKNCERTNGQACSETQRPENRYLTTSHDKRMFLNPGEAGFISLPVSSYMKIEDSLGAVIKSHGRLAIQADGVVSLDANKVVLDAPKEVTLIRRKVGSPAVLNVCYNFEIIGYMGGFSTTKPPAPKKSSSSALGKMEDVDTSEIQNMAFAAIPADSGSESNPLLNALQGTFVAHLPSERSRN